LRRFRLAVPLLIALAAATAVGSVATVALAVPAVHLGPIIGVALVLLYVGALMMGVGQRAAEISPTTRSQRSTQARRTAQAWWAAQPPASRGGDRLT
jgi:hypothetical protein